MDENIESKVSLASFFLDILLMQLFFFFCWQCNDSFCQRIQKWPFKVLMKIFNENTEVKSQSFIIARVVFLFSHVNAQYFTRLNEIETIFYIYQIETTMQVN